MNGSNEIIIGATNTQFIDGDRSARYPKREEYVDSGIMFLNGESISRGTINKEAVNFITEQKYRDIKKGRIARNDILLTTRGNSIGDAAFVTTSDKGLINAQMLILRADSRDIHPKYLFYYITSNSLRNYILNFASGSAQPQIPIRDLKKIPIYLPKIQVQRKIAAILSAYDELIENNQRRIALLEKMAEEVYREWFVRLRFPGHEKVKRVKGVPEGWQISELQDVSIEASRSVKAGAHLADRYYLPLDMLNTRKMNPDGHLNYTEAQSSLVTFEKGDILFGAMRPYLHKVAIAPFAGITRTTCFVIRPRTPQSLSWLFLTLFQQSSVDYASMICNGSDRPYAVWNKGMERMKLLCPDDALLSKFEEAVRPILDSITSMYFVQLKLRDCRDTLLPRLISGKLSVEHLDIRFPPGMEESACV